MLLTLLIKLLCIFVVFVAWPLSLALYLDMR
jgi:hypothetical protein